MLKYPGCKILIRQMMFEVMTQTQKTPYQILGGDKAVRELVMKFYELMDTLPELHALRSIHAPDLSGAIDKLYKFLSGWLGGPQLYINEYGHPRLRARHMPFPIDNNQRDQWLYCMFKAMDELNVDAGLQKQLKQAFTQTANHMINQRSLNIHR